jgi:hypothetical protein
VVSYLYAINGCATETVAPAHLTSPRIIYNLYLRCFVLSEAIGIIRMSE